MPSPPPTQIKLVFAHSCAHLLGFFLADYSTFCLTSSICVTLPDISFHLRQIIVSKLSHPLTPLFKVTGYPALRGGWSLFQRGAGIRRESSQHFGNMAHIERQTLTFTPTVSLDCGKKPDDPRRTHTGAGRTCKNSKSKSLK